jgi:hypothetical protein
MKSALMEGDVVFTSIVREPDAATMAARRGNPAAAAERKEGEPPVPREFPGSLLESRDGSLLPRAEVKTDRCNTGRDGAYVGNIGCDSNLNSARFHLISSQANSLRHLPFGLKMLHWDLPEIGQRALISVGRVCP